MEFENKKMIINLFNSGKLSMDAADWYRNHGFAVICNDGKVTDIVKEA